MLWLGLLLGISFLVGACARATEEDFSPVECVQGGGCAISPACMFKGVLAEALGVYLAVLGKYTLADVVRNRALSSSLPGIEKSAA